MRVGIKKVECCWQRIPVYGHCNKSSGHKSNDNKFPPKKQLKRNKVVKLPLGQKQILT